MLVFISLSTILIQLFLNRVYVVYDFSKLTSSLFDNLLPLTFPSSHYTIV